MEDVSVAVEGLRRFVDEGMGFGAVEEGPDGLRRLVGDGMGFGGLLGEEEGLRRFVGEGMGFGGEEGVVALLEAVGAATGFLGGCDGFGGVLLSFECGFDAFLLFVEA